MKIDRNKLLSNVKYTLLFIYISLMFIYGGQEGKTIYFKIPMYIFIVLEFVSMIKNKKIFVFKNLIPLVLFSAFLFISSLWAINGDLSFTIAKTVSLLVAFTLFVYNFLITEENSYIKLMKITMYAGIVFMIYIVAYYGFDNYMKLVTSGLRVGEEIDNTNRIGLEVSATYLIALFFGTNYNKKYYLILPLSLLIALGTGSRKVIAFLILGTILIFLLKSEKNKVRGLFKKIVFVVFFVFMLNILSELLNDFIIVKRLETFLNFFSGSGAVDHSTLERNIFIKYGWNEFLNHPILGIGAGNAGYVTMKAANWFTYLHNNYIELLATTGVIGFTLYYSNFIILFKQLLKKDSSGDKNIRSFLIILLLLILMMDYGTVSYYSKTTYIYFLFVLLYCEKEKSL